MRAAIALASLILLAGCIGTLDDEDNDANPTHLPTGTPSQEALAERSLHEAPDWHQGEWWDIQVDVHPTGETYETRIVVADARDDEILLGTPLDAFHNEIMIVHFPPVGPMNTQDLAWFFHSDPFPMTPFPLEEGKTWTFPWFDGEATAHVETTQGTKATVHVTHEAENTLQASYELTYTYDAQQGFVTMMEWAGSATWRIIDHGFEHEGPLLVPDDIELSIFEAHAGGLLDARQLQPATSTMDVHVDEGRDTMIIGFILTDIATDEPAGTYHAKATHPNGTTYQASLTPGDGTNAIIHADHVTNPHGAWTLEFETTGTGAAVIEALAYNERIYHVTNEPHP